jgi:hypothetical protein
LQANVALPQKVKQYVSEHYHEKIREASGNKNVNCQINYETDISRGRAILFGKGNFIKERRTGTVIILFNVPIEILF